MKHLSLKDVQEFQNKKGKKRQEAFDHILSKVYRHIEKCVTTMRNTYYCFFEVPEFLLGFPLYDLNECITYIQEQLTKGGFDTKYFFPRVLLISWYPKHPKPKKKMLEAPKTTTGRGTGAGAGRGRGRGSKLSL